MVILNIEMRQILNYLFTHAENTFYIWCCIWQMKSILNEYKSNIALIVGNGVYRYRFAKTTNSWHDLLMQLAKEHFPSGLKKVPSGVALTEFYDLLELKTTNVALEKTLQQKFCDLMATWKPFKHHERIIKWVKLNSNPVLTTKFDKVLAW